MQQLQRDDAILPHYQRPCCGMGERGPSFRVSVMLFIYILIICQNIKYKKLSCCKETVQLLPVAASSLMPLWQRYTASQGAAQIRPADGFLYNHCPSFSNMVGQFRPNETGRRCFADIVGLSSITVT